MSSLRFVPYPERLCERLRLIQAAALPRDRRKADSTRKVSGAPDCRVRLAPLLHHRDEDVHSIDTPFAANVLTRLSRRRC